MSIYIKGMEMPTSCGYCPLRHEARDGDECYLGASLTEYQKRPDDCPLFPIPDHGDLIERDAAIQALKPVDRVMETRANEYWSMIWADECQTLSENVPTIIPASEGGEK